MHPSGGVGRSSGGGTDGESVFAAIRRLEPSRPLGGWTRVGEWGSQWPVFVWVGGGGGSGSYQLSILSTTCFICPQSNSDDIYLHFRFTVMVLGISEEYVL